MNIHDEVARIFTEAAERERSTTAAEMKAQDHLRDILLAYERCGGENLQLPTPLLCAIIAARETC